MPHPRLLPLAEGKSEYNPLSLPVVAALSVAALSLPQPSARKGLLGAVVAITVYCALCTASGDMMADEGNMSWMSMNMWMLSDFILLHDTHREFRRVTVTRDSNSSDSSEVLKKKKEEEEEGSPSSNGKLSAIQGSQNDHWWPKSSALERLRLSFDLLVNPRGLGFIHGPGGAHAHSPRTTKLKCIARHTYTLLRSVLLFDLAQIAMSLNTSFDFHPSFTGDGAMRPMAREVQVAFGAQPLWLRPTIIAHAVTGAAAICGTYSLWTIGVVALGVEEPREWPFLFGEWSEGWSVRRLWGKVWHQMLRHLVTAHANALHALLARTFGVARDSWFHTNASFKYYFKVYIAFAVSAALHFFSEYILLQDARQTLWGPCLFFLVQPLAITLEGFVGYLARRVSNWEKGDGRKGYYGAGGKVRVPPWWFRALGFCWVVVWFSLTLPMWVELLVRLGHVEGGRYDSVVGQAVKWVVAKVI